MSTTRRRSHHQFPAWEEILALVEREVPYAEIGRRLSVHPGLVHLVATGHPADGSAAPAPGTRDRPGYLATSQHLSNPEPLENATTNSALEDWIQRRAAGDEQMQRAAALRTAEPPPVHENQDEKADIIDVLGRDHKHVTNLIKQLGAIPGAKKGGSAARASARKSIVDIIIVLLSMHVTAEQRHLWPTVRKTLDNGDVLADQALAIDRHGEDVLAALARLGGDEEQFDDLVEGLSAAARKHVAFQGPVFLRLREEVPDETLRALADVVVSAREHGPTRPHRDAPKKQPGVAVSAVAGAPMDHARGALTGRREDLRPTTTSASTTGLGSPAVPVATRPWSGSSRARRTATP